jgi:hypothetical protein
MMDLHKGDYVLLSCGDWFTVTRGAYRYINGYTSSYNPQYSDWMFTADPAYDDGIGWNNRQLQIIAVREVWRDGVQVWPPAVEQLSLFAEGD